MPDWYPVIRAARYMHAKPWEVLPDGQAAKVPRRFWLLWAQIAEAAENEAMAQAQKEHGGRR